MRHDYDLPPDWSAMTDEEKSRWMTQERCRRQVRRQGRATQSRMEERRDRVERILEARGYEYLPHRR